MLNSNIIITGQMTPTNLDNDIEGGIVNNEGETIFGKDNTISQGKSDKNENIRFRKTILDNFKISETLFSGTYKHKKDDNHGVTINNKEYDEEIGSYIIKEIKELKKNILSKKLWYLIEVFCAIILICLLYFTYIKFSEEIFDEELDNNLVKSNLDMNNTETITDLLPSIK